MTSYLYRAYDRKGNLLYVGITNRIGSRINAHMRGAIWASELSAFKLQKHPSMLSAALAEINAIKSEKPLFNKIRYSNVREESEYLNMVREKYTDHHHLVKEGILHFGSPGAFCERLGVTRQAMHQWKDGLPELRKYQIREIINNTPKAEKPMLRKSNNNGSEK